MEQKKELPSLQELLEANKDAKKQRRLKNWNCTVDSITRNLADGGTVAWSDYPLDDDQVFELRDKGFTVEISTVNNCHKISW